jgi:hypothetical protein
MSFSCTMKMVSVYRNGLHHVHTLFREVRGQVREHPLVSPISEGS